MNNKVFVSYPGETSDQMILLTSYLKEQGIQSLWLDINEIHAGENIAQRLVEGIRESACCILILNKFSLSSTWCMAEVGAFWGAEKPIIIYTTEPRCDVPPYLNGLKYASGSSDVVEACKKFIDRPREPIIAHPQNPLVDLLIRCGLSNAFRIPVDDHAREKRVAELVSDERRRSGKKQFRLLASSGHNYLHKMGKVWRAGLGEAIAEGADFSAVLESPVSPFAYTRALASEVDYHHWEERVDVNHLEKLDKKCDNVIIRVTEHPVNCSLFFTSESVFYDPYIWAKPIPTETIENHFWVFDFKRVDEVGYDCYNLLGMHFEFLARESVPLKEFLGEGRRRYHELTDEFKRKINEQRIKENK